MQAANRLQQALRSGRPSFGGWQMLPGANLSRVLARTPGLDWICVDTEHGNISDDSMHASVAAIAACGVSPVVRVPEGQHWMLKRALDAGAHAVMIPVIHTVDEARTVVRASKFPPQGTRGLGSPFSMEKFAPADRYATPLSQTDYLLEANEATLVIVQIETQSALAAVNEIAAIPGIDVLLVGPYDLGNSIGHPVLTAEFDAGLTAAIATILAAAKAHGKKAAIYAASGEQARRYAEQGFDMVNTMNDVVALQQAFGVASLNAAKTE